MLSTYRYEDPKHERKEKDCLSFVVRPKAQTAKSLKYHSSKYSSSFETTLNNVGGLTSSRLKLAYLQCFSASDHLQTRP